MMTSNQQFLFIIASILNIKHGFSQHGVFHLYHHQTSAPPRLSEASLLTLGQIYIHIDIYL